MSKESIRLKIDRNILEYFQDFEVSPMGGKIYIILCAHLKPEDEVCFPTIKTISGYARIAERNIFKYIKELENAGLIELLRFEELPNEMQSRLLEAEGYLCKSRNYYKLANS